MLVCFDSEPIIINLKMAKLFLQMFRTRLRSQIHRNFNPVDKFVINPNDKFY